MICPFYFATVNNTPEKIHSYHLFPEGLTEEGRKNILGAQGMLWTELMPSAEDVEYQAYPRACAVAELTWTAQELRGDTEGFMSRLSAHGDRLTALGLNHRRLTHPPSLKWSPEFLVTRTDWLFPVPSSLTDSKSLELSFDFKSGCNGLDIEAVELLADGQAIAEDRHPGFSGNSPKDQIYKIAVPAGTQGKLSLRISANGSKGIDSVGKITLSGKP